MWCYRRTLKVKRTEKITNDAVKRENENFTVVLKSEETKKCRTSIAPRKRHRPWYRMSRWRNNTEDGMYETNCAWKRDKLQGLNTVKKKEAWTIAANRSNDCGRVEWGFADRSLGVPALLTKHGVRFLRSKTVSSGTIGEGERGGDKRRLPKARGNRFAQLVSGLRWRRRTVRSAHCVRVSFLGRTPENWI